MNEGEVKNRGAFRAGQTDGSGRKLTMLHDAHSQTTRSYALTDGTMTHNQECSRPRPIKDAQALDSRKSQRIGLFSDVAMDQPN